MFWIAPSSVNLIRILRISVRMINLILFETIPTALKIYFLLVATVCIATTTKIIQCLRQWQQWTRSYKKRLQKMRFGISTWNKNTTKKNDAKIRRAGLGRHVECDRPDRPA